jgi:hypothetical protein
LEKRQETTSNPTNAAYALQPPLIVSLDCINC